MTDEPTRLSRRSDPATRPTNVFSTEGGTELGLDVRIVRGAPTASEIAAVTAVLSAAVAEEALSAPGHAAAPSDWQRSQRSLRDQRTFRSGR